MHVTVTAVVYLALEIVPNVSSRLQWWGLGIGSMLLAKVVCFQSMIAAVLTEKHGISTRSIHNVKRRFLIVLEYVRPNMLHKIGTMSKRLLKLSCCVVIKRLKLSCCVVIKRLHFVATGKERIQSKEEFFRNIEPCCNS